ncbi:MAG: Exodeoxyribonuclease VII large subunit (EC [uncultured Thiotrichaceae bacterium]|uniref:Exodeoxyribonuclease 7 large subunit n=1 Tax=uncultured Thiotrichaceae bacterium TaxID=298394 RepID=A0A6S6SQ70_9GAMM|nr:MAG: Exodeoxyribonuclease VII large subunit (EC [uncultured Thiotrichaceae bacterium]
MIEQIPQRSILKVSELNAEVSLLLKTGFPLLWVEGEISNLAQPSSGHIYFSLKDAKAQVRCAMFRNRRMSMAIRPKNGLKVLARVKVGLYEPRGEYQLIVEDMEDAGIGQLQKDFEALKKKLAAKGMFDDIHKKPIPPIPQRIGIITSPSGAAVRDIINVLKRRAPHIPILIYPVSVQGENSAPEIIKAIQRADSEQKCDVLLLTRGGGSIEDLWSFNEEAVAEAMYQCETPIVSGVGHEIDFTIADFVSDQRAPTPSAAAELISPERAQQLQQLRQWRNRLITQFENVTRQQKQQLKTLQQRLSIQSPDNQLRNQAQRVDELELRMHRAILQKEQQHTATLKQLKLRLINQSPAQRIQLQQSQLSSLKKRFKNAIEQQMNRRTDRMNRSVGTLNTISPLATLQRGYSISRYNNHVVRSIKEVKKDDNISVLVGDGELDCCVLKKHPHKK